MQFQELNHGLTWTIQVFFAIVFVSSWNYWEVRCDRFLQINVDLSCLSLMGFVESLLPHLQIGVVY